MIEVLKQALEALESCGEGHITDGGNQWHDAKLVDTATTSLRQAIAKAEDNYQGSDAAKAAHMMDLYTALGIRWGDNPFAVIAKMRSIAELESQELHSWYSVKHDEWMTEKTRKDHERLNSYTHKVGGFDLPLYTHPPQRTWVGLTDEDIWDVFGGRIGTSNSDVNPIRLLADARKIEDKLKEKNT